MILTQCAVCATELGLSLGKKCGRCSTRYCGPECQAQHWKEGGHDMLCKKIKKAGGAEQYNANKKYTEAVAAAVEKCADDTKGQTCYICTQALHWKTKEGLVRGCSCRGTAGFAHVSCLEEEAKILVAEAEENNLGAKVLDQRWGRWHTCGLCEQDYHGAVRCALGWACWKTYLGRPETDKLRHFSFNVLGSGLFEANQDEDALSVMEAQVSMQRRHGESAHNFLVAQSSLASAYNSLGRREQALRVRQDIYSKCLSLYGEEHAHTLGEASNYATSLAQLQRFEEAKALLRKIMPMARRALGDDSKTTLGMRKSYAQALYLDAGATFDDLREAVATLEATERTARRVLGGSHPIVTGLGKSMRASRTVLAAREGGDVSALRAAVDAMKAA